MKGELKAGGLALILRDQYSENIGKCVTLVKYCNHGDNIVFNGKNYRYTGIGAWFCTGDITGSMSKQAVKIGAACLYSKNLMPIDDSNPDFMNDKEKEFKY